MSVTCLWAAFGDHNKSIKKTRDNRLNTETMKGIVRDNTINIPINTKVGDTIYMHTSGSLSTVKIDESVVIGVIYFDD